MKIIAECWSCGREESRFQLSVGPDGYSMKCECGGYLVTPSGKMKFKMMKNGQPIKRLKGRG